MKFILSFICIFFFCHLNAQNVNVAWAKGIGSRQDDYCTSVATDAYGNVYATGFFNGTVDFDPGPGVFYLTAGLYGNIFITKMDPAGNLIWARQIGTGHCSANCIKLDMSGDIYITGDFSSTVDFDPGPNVYNLTTPNIVTGNAFVSKYNSSGNFIWAKSFYADSSGTTGSGFRLAIDNNGNVYTGGYYFDTCDFDPGSGVHKLISNGAKDIFISKLDSSGNFIWAKSFGGLSDDYLFGLSLDISGNVYTAGSFGDLVDDNPHAYINKLDSSGNLVWSKNINCTGPCLINSMVIDKDKIYTSGSFMDTAHFNTASNIVDLISQGGYNVFLCRLDTACNFIWAKSFGGNYQSIDIDSYGNIYNTGEFNSDAFINKFDSLGNFLWAKYMGGNSYNAGLSTALDRLDNIYVGGIFQGTSNFDGIILTANPAPNNYPMPTSDFFILKLIQIENPIVWKGSVSNSWSVAGNWDKNVIPDINSNVVIPSGLLIYPIVDTTAEIKSLFLQNGASLKVESNVKLKIDGH